MFDQTKYCRFPLRNTTERGEIRREKAESEGEFAGKIGVADKVAEDVKPSKKTIFRSSSYHLRTLARNLKI